MLDHPNFPQFDLSCLRKGWIGGAQCPREVMLRLVNDLGMHGITPAYGMTETSPSATQASPDDPSEQRVSTAGRVQPHVEMVDFEGQTVRRGAEGEVCVRGYNVMLSYRNDPEGTGAAIDRAR